jgi:cytoskeletal protein RodZ
MAALGEEFRSAREARGLTVAEVAERLHIRSFYLAAIEDEDWTAIGAPVYVRGFMRTYARFLGIDAESAVARLGSLANPASAPSEAAGVTRRAQPPGDLASPTDESSERRGLSPLAIITIVVAVLVVAFLGYQVFGVKPAPNAVPIAVASVGDGNLASSPANPVAATSKDTSAASPASTSSPTIPVHGLGVHLSADSWLRIVVDGKPMMEGLYPAGTTRMFDGRSIVVRAGNAGGLELSANGRSLGKLGGNGDVVERHIDLSAY